jgi:hypothetical protein
MSKKTIRDIAVGSASTVGGAVFAWALSFFPSIWGPLKEGIGWLSSASHIPAWLLAVMGAACAWAVYRRGHAVPAWRREYRSDRFGDVRWRWEYTLDGGVFDLKPYCIADHHTQLVPVPDPDGLQSFSLLCATCGRETMRVSGNLDELCASTERKIEDKIQNGLWEGSGRS